MDKSHIKNEQRTESLFDALPCIHLASFDMPCPL